MLRSLKQDTARIPKSFILDTLASANVSPAERLAAERQIDVWTPDSNGNVSYEDLVFLLGERGHEKCAVHLMEHLGPTSSLLRLPARPGETWLAPKLYWPGNVSCDGDVVVHRGAVGGKLTVNGSITYGDLRTGQQPDCRSLVASTGNLVSKMRFDAAAESTAATPVFRVEDMDLPSREETDLGLDYLQSALSGSADSRPAAKPHSTPSYDDELSPR